MIGGIVPNDQQLANKINITSRHSLRASISRHKCAIGVVASGINRWHCRQRSTGRQPAVVLATADETKLIVYVSFFVTLNSVFGFFSSGRHPIAQNSSSANLEHSGQSLRLQAPQDFWLTVFFPQTLLWTCLRARLQHLTSLLQPVGASLQAPMSRLLPRPLKKRW
jgi:hypothetical protein